MATEKPGSGEPGCGVAPETIRRLRPKGEIGGSRDLRPSSASRRTAVEQTAGALTGTYAPGELESLREGWPA
jgi:hypothetical protein